MNRKSKISIGAFIVLLSALLIFAFTHVPSLSENYGKLETKLYLAKSEKQPLIVAFGGGGGGNDWTRKYLEEKRDSLTYKGYALLAIGYFKSEGTPSNLDRISLDAIRDTISSVAQHPKIDASKIVLLGSSKGGELVLNLASRYSDFRGVIALSTSHVSFPALTWTANTSCWMYQDTEVPYVPAPVKTIWPALEGDLYTAHRMMLEDQEAVKRAEIPVENIAGPILLLSGKEDEQWPSTQMSDAIVNRLERNDFQYEYVHAELVGGHTVPLENFNWVYRFLEKHFPAR